MDIPQADMQLCAARELRWMPDVIHVTAHEILIEGWALAVWDELATLRLLINGEDAADLSWLPSPDIEAHFATLPQTQTCRFLARHPVAPERPAYHDGFIRLNITSSLGEHRQSYRTAWFACDPALEPEAPSEARIARVIGTHEPASFQWGGATILKRIEHLLSERFGRPLSTFSDVLDWGCGAGRVSRYLPLVASNVTGIDIDLDNIEHCRATIPGVRFLHTPLHPPTPFADDSFALVIGISVVTHLREANQDAWLGELQRLVRPGGLVLLSVQGWTQSALYRASSAQQRDVQQAGILYVGKNPQLVGVIDDDDYYVDVIQSHDYIYHHWGRYFDVLDILPAMAGNQDLVVLRARPAAPAP